MLMAKREFKRTLFLRESSVKGAYMKIKALDNYFDLEKRKQIKKDEIYEVSQKRAKEICDKKLAEIVGVKNGKQDTESK